MDMYCLGPEGTYGHEAAYEAARLFFPTTSFEMIFCTRNEEVLERIAENKDMAFGVVPMRNSTAGLVNEVARYWLNQKDQRSFFSSVGNLPSSGLRVIGEIDLSIHHHLLAPLEIELDKVQKVLSHTQALAQCEQNLSMLGVSYEQRVSVASTAGAAKMVAESGDQMVAALASRFCADLYGLKILKSNLEDVAGNSTRFHIVSNWNMQLLSEGIRQNNEKKIAMLLWLPNEDGALLRAIGPIAAARLNMSFIYSIQLTSMNEVAFYIELEAHRNNPSITDSVLRLVSSASDKIVVLGEFKNGIVLEY